MKAKARHAITKLGGPDGKTETGAQISIEAETAGEAIELTKAFGPFGENGTLKYRTVCDEETGIVVRVLAWHGPSNERSIDSI